MANLPISSPPVFTSEIYQTKSEDLITAELENMIKGALLNNRKASCLSNYMERHNRKAIHLSNYMEQHFWKTFFFSTRGTLS